MPSLPLVSTVMPLWNISIGEKFIWFRHAVESIVNQTYDGPIELVLVDDGSTDNTVNAVLLCKQEFECSDRKFCYHKIPRSGITRALNYGLGRSSGEFIARLDADDWSIPSRFSKQVEFLMEHPEVALVGTPVWIIRNSRVTGEVWNKLTSHEELVEGLKERNRLAHSSVMFRRTVLDSVGVYNPEYLYAQDWEFWWRIAQKHKIAQLPEPLTYYRIHKWSISKDERSGQQMSFALQIKEAINSGALK